MKVLIVAANNSLPSYTVDDAVCYIITVIFLIKLNFDGFFLFFNSTKETLKEK